MRDNLHQTIRQEYRAGCAYVRKPSNPRFIVPHRVEFAIRNYRHNRTIDISLPQNMIQALRSAILDNHVMARETIRVKANNSTIYNLVKHNFAKKYRQWYILTPDGLRLAKNLL